MEETKSTGISSAYDAVHKASVLPPSAERIVIRGYSIFACFMFTHSKFGCLFFSEDFSGDYSLDSMVQKMISTGFQATNVGLAIEEINKMVSFSRNCFDSIIC